ncbi:MAG TPA: phosphoribosylaminoimidazolesuccinocarboxamide synthase [Candidatus Sulfotelmatobacter sp.]|nr:phosphoribosylaminoimidazolesuccinocarboxamide synthase [Candidatus Sulfotelmatobacter sp.]
MTTTSKTMPRIDLPLFKRGKVRDTYDLGDGTLLMVASDRISAFDVVLPTEIPDKGAVLTQMSRWWFERTSSIVPNHLVPDNPHSLPNGVDWDAVALRSMRTVLAQRIDIECVVRGYLSGSGWKEYRDSGTLAEEPLPPGLSESSRLPEPRFTPATKSEEGHDVNISRRQLADSVGVDLARRLEEISLSLFEYGARQCESAGLILADTKFEFGFRGDELILIDEVLTPDSSRFWEMSEWREGQPAASFDKQFVRDHLESVGWNKTPPAPELPGEVVAGTRDRYLEAARRICGIDVASMSVDER